jgi:outer membrane protein OmpA-like peptidoglycan-associated protein
MYRSSVVLVVAMVALAGCATMGRQVEVHSGDLAMDIERARQDTARARATYDTLKEQRRAVDARTIAFEDSLTRAREIAATAAAAAAAAAAARDSAQRVAAASVTTPEPGGGERALSDAEMRIMSQQIYFAFNSVHLTTASRALLREKAAILARNPSLTLTLTGHADARGPADYNRRLSERRAAAVQRFLVELGVTPERLTSEGRGEEAPAVQGSGERVWQRNRRVEFLIS